MSKRVLIAGFKHETNTFSKLPTDMDAYRKRALHYGEDIIPAYAGTNTEIAGFLDACEKYDWEPVLSVVADATPSGLVSAEAYDEITGCIFKTIEEAGPLDAILLQLHGAMVAEGHDDAPGGGERLYRSSKIAQGAARQAGAVGRQIGRAHV